MPSVNYCVEESKLVDHGGRVLILTDKTTGAEVALFLKTAGYGEPAVDAYLYMLMALGDTEVDSHLKALRSARWKELFP